MDSKDEYYIKNAMTALFELAESLCFDSDSVAEFKSWIKRELLGE